MKPEDLMVGDWFRVRYVFDGKDFVRTFRISKTVDDLGFVCGKGLGPVCLPEELEPILLTPEILEKNGWKSLQNGSGDFVNPGFITLRKGIIEGFELYHLGYNGLTIDYVHELQHALKLCGINKEIVV